MSALSSLSLLDRNLLHSLSRAPLSEKIKVAQAIWTSPSTALPTDEAATATAFFVLLRSETLMVQHYQQLFAPCTIDAVKETIGVLRTSSAQPLHEVVSKLRNSFINVDDASIQRTLELCVRLWLTVNVNTRLVSVGGMFPRERTLDWANEMSITTVLDQAFRPSCAPRRRVKLDGRFNAEYLVNNCDLELEWTNYLTDHLRLDATRRVLLVYRHKVYLNDSLMKQADGPIPLAVLGEALDSLNLLFPFGDGSTKQLLARYDEKALYTLGACGRERPLDLSQFTYWRDQLEALLEIYDSPPRTWKQLAVDRRNKLEWSAFWVTVMVAFLTLVSVPCSIIQAVYSVKAYNIALTQSAVIGRNEL